MTEVEAMDAEAFAAKLADTVLRLPGCLGLGAVDRAPRDATASSMAITIAEPAAPHVLSSLHAVDVVASEDHVVAVVEIDVNWVDAPEELHRSKGDVIRGTTEAAP